MAHEITITAAGKADMAYATGTAKPWHGLGQTVDPSASPEEWARAANLTWHAKRSQVNFANEVTGEPAAAFTGKEVLYRSDTGSPLSVVSDDYRVVQPDDVLTFFAKIAGIKDFQIETVGSLNEGRRIWALARVGQSAKIMDDMVAPYLLLATSYDATMATVAQFTAVRVVCSNTLRACLSAADDKKRVSVPHSAIFNPEKVRADLGINLNAWELFKREALGMSRTQISDTETAQYLQTLLSEFIPYGQTYSPEKVTNSKGYQRIMALFHGGQIGAGQDAVKGSAWGILQAVTQYIDHEKGRLPDNRLNGAWFGPGDKIKQRAYEIAVELAAPQIA